ncbi:MAG TPA: nuclear transport factor 2 family protein [Bryocella sp.]|nr:nuclear transport factor 2 family protein [Bryocella sp.]
MRFSARMLLGITAAVLLFIPKLSAAAAQAPANSAESQAIISMLNRTADDWNRGDLDAFARGYKNSPDILFMGPTIRRGYEQMLQGYRKSFPNRKAMGKLTFSNLEVQPLDQRFATVTGRFHLERTAAGGGAAGGYFLLVVEKTPSGWKIIRDATTGDARPAH